MPLPPKALLIAAALLLGYEGLLAVCPDSMRAVAESQWHDNRIRAQRYLYEQRQADTVVVGSSLARRLDEHLGKADIVNLSFGGRSPLDGLRLIARSGAAPRLVLVEVNHLDRGADEDFLGSLLSPGRRYLREHLRALRTYYRPLSVAAALMRNGFAESFERLRDGARHSAGRGPMTSAAGIPHALFAQLLQRQIRAHREKPTPRRLERLVGQLEDVFGTLRARGSTIVLFEMPTHPRLCVSRHLRALRRTLERRLGDYVSRYAQAPDCTAFATTDAHHLDPASAQRYGAELEAWIRQSRSPQQLPLNRRTDP